MAKRGRDSEQTEISSLVDEIRAAKEDSSKNYEERAKFIKDQLDRMSEDELTRFEFFVRSHFSRSRIRDMMCKNLQPTEKQLITDDMAIAVCGLAKLFVGELMQTANDCTRASEGIRAAHIEEAMRRMLLEGKIESQASNSFLFDKCKTTACADAYLFDLDDNT